MSSIKIVQVDASTIDTPATGQKVFFVDSSNGKYSCKDSSGVVSIVGEDGVFDANAIHTNLSSEISSLSNKGAPIAGDYLIIEDFEDSNSKKYIFLGQLSGLIDHGSISGLGDDDHTQYLNETRHDSLPADNPHSVTASQVGAPPTGRQIIAGSELSGGGDLSADRTINHDSSGVTPGTYTYSTVTVNSFGHVTSASSGAAPTPIFGAGFQESSSLGLSSTNSTTYQNKVTLTTGSLDAGTYRIGWSYAWSFSSTGDDFRGRVLMDGVTIMSHSQEPKDPGTDQVHRVSGFEYFPLSAGVHTFNLQYASSDAADTSWIQRARLEIWRVS